MSAQPQPKPQPERHHQKDHFRRPFRIGILPNMSEQRRGQTPPVFTRPPGGGLWLSDIFPLYDVEDRIPHTAGRELFDTGHSGTRPEARHGGARRDRTDDLMLAKHALSQLSYGPDETKRTEKTWWAWDDSNVRPHPYQGCALTT
jgi:hypothetical protein